METLDGSSCGSQFFKLFGTSTGDDDIAKGIGGIVSLSQSPASTWDVNDLLGPWPTGANLNSNQNCTSNNSNHKSNPISSSISNVNLNNVNNNSSSTRGFHGNLTCPLRTEGVGSFQAPPGSKSNVSIDSYSLGSSTTSSSLMSRKGLSESKLNCDGLWSTNDLFSPLSDSSYNSLLSTASTSLTKGLESCLNPNNHNPMTTSNNSTTSGSSGAASCFDNVTLNHLHQNHHNNQQQQHQPHHQPHHNHNHNHNHNQHQFQLNQHQHQQHQNSNIQRNDLVSSISLNLTGGGNNKSSSSSSSSFLFPPMVKGNGNCLYDIEPGTSVSLSHSGGVGSASRRGTLSSHYGSSSSSSSIIIDSPRVQEDEFESQIGRIANEIHSTIQLHMSGLQIRREQLLQQLDNVKRIYLQLFKQQQSSPSSPSTGSSCSSGSHHLLEGGFGSNGKNGNTNSSNGNSNGHRRMNRGGGGGYDSGCEMSTTGSMISSVIGGGSSGSGSGSGSSGHSLPIPSVTFTKPDSALLKAVSSLGFLTTPAFAPCCSATGDGLEVAVPGLNNNFTIVTRNCFNEELLIGRENILVKIVPSFSGSGSSTSTTQNSSSASSPSTSNSSSPLICGSIYGGAGGAGGLGSVGDNRNDGSHIVKDVVKDLLGLDINAPNNGSNGSNSSNSTNSNSSSQQHQQNQQQHPNGFGINNQHKLGSSDSNNGHHPGGQQSSLNIPYTLLDHNNGKYTVTYLVPQSRTLPSELSITILVNCIPLNESPFHVPVQLEQRSRWRLGLTFGSEGNAIGQLCRPWGVSIVRMPAFMLSPQYLASVANTTGGVGGNSNGTNGGFGSNESNLNTSSSNNHNLNHTFNVTSTGNSCSSSSTSLNVNNNSNPNNNNSSNTTSATTTGMMSVGNNHHVHQGLQQSQSSTSSTTQLQQQQQQQLQQLHQQQQQQPHQQQTNNLSGQSTTGNSNSYTSSFFSSDNSSGISLSGNTGSSVVGFPTSQTSNSNGSIGSGLCGSGNNTITGIESSSNSPGSGLGLGLGCLGLGSGSRNGSAKHSTTTSSTSMGKNHNHNKHYLIAVADRSNNRIQLLHLDAGAMNIKVIQVFGSGPGTRAGLFDRPAGISINTSLSHIIVADKDNHRIQVFDLSGRYQFKFGEKGNRAGQFCYPWDVDSCSHTHQILVSDTRNRRVQLFTPYGQYITHFSHPLDSPRGVSFLGDNRIVVSDFNKHRLLIFDKFPSKEDASKVIGFGEGTGWGEFLRPQGISIMGNSIFCSDSRNNRICIYNLFTQSFEYLGQDLSCDRPSGLHVIDNILVIVDFGNNRLEICQR